MPRLPPELTQNRAILFASVFLAAFANVGFFGKVISAYPLSSATAPALVSLGVALVAVHCLLFGLLCFGRAFKPMLGTLLLVSAATAYFVDRFGIVIDTDMLRNVAQTDFAEAGDLLTPALAGYLVALGGLPVLALRRLPIVWRGWRSELRARAGLLAVALLVLVGCLLAFGSFYASFLREHKTLRNYANPERALYSLVRYTLGGAREPAMVYDHGTDAHLAVGDRGRELIVLVVGETARADHFSLNGYARDTTPRMRAADAISFPDFRACGTSTAAALPCMFADASLGASPGTYENVLDVLQRAGVNVLWLDNNSDSKGVASRVPYRNFKSPEVNPVCDIECRDEGMLVGLQAYVDAHPQGDILIVLHQMGNHGPAYYKRYPAAFEKFVPACHSNDLSQCSREEIVNAYDNAILYTDHFLTRIVDFLRRNDPGFEAALFYVSDHGESLGENGVYLHGLPKAFAPAAQLQVPALMWFAPGFQDVDVAAVRARRERHFTHEHIFHTLLGLFEIETAVYRSELDMLAPARKAAGK